MLFQSHSRGFKIRDENKPRFAMANIADIRFAHIRRFTKRDANFATRMLKRRIPFMNNIS